MLRLWLGRHGETEWNLQGRYQGQVDTALSPRGIEQGEALARALADVHLDAVIASPLSRALQTAAGAARDHGLTPTTDARWTEINHGEWEGMYSTDIARSDGARLEAWRTAPETVTMPGGESLADVRARVRSALADYIDRYDGQTLLVVAHDAVNKVLLADILGLTPAHFWQFKQDNGCLNLLEYEAGIWRIVTLNATAHLGYLCSGIEQRGL